MIRLYGFEVSGNCYKIRLFLSLINYDYENVVVDVKAGENRTPEFLQMNPNGLLPVVTDGDNVIYDSAAILTYLAATYAEAWLPREPIDLARVVRWLAFEQSEGRYGLARARAMVRKMPSPMAKLGTLDESQTIATEALQILEQQLSQSRWLIGNDHPTIADIACYPYTAMSEQGGLSLDPYPAINRWLDAVRQLPGYVSLPG